MAGQGKLGKGETRKLVGISFPFRKDKGQFPKVEIDTDAVKNDLFALFNTPIRSRVMRPLVGTTAYALVFESMGPLLIARLERSIRQTIFLNEPRVNVLGIETAENNTEIVALVVYEIQGIQDFIELKFPKENEGEAA